MLTILLILSILFFIGYLLSLVIPTIKFYINLGLKNVNPFIEESINIPNYEPAIMSYLMNYQKIGKREICSTLFDLIAKGAIEIELEKGLVTENEGEYSFKVNCKDISKRFIYGFKKRKRK